MQWSGNAAVYISQFWAQTTGFLYPHCSSALLFVVGDCGSCLAGNLAQLQDANWKGPLVSSVIFSPANC